MGWIGLVRYVVRYSAATFAVEAVCKPARCLAGGHGIVASYEPEGHLRPNLGSSGGREPRQLKARGANRSYHNLILA